MDKDLKFLQTWTNDELDPLVNIITDTFSNFLAISDRYKEYYPDHQKYLLEIEKEFLAYGGNTFTNFFGNPTYRDILEKVCKELDVAHNPNDPDVWGMERNLLEKVTGQDWEETSDAQKEDFLEEFDAKSIWGTNGGMLGNAAKKGLIYTGLRLLVGSLISAAWLAHSIAGPAFRVIVPCVVYIALMRDKKARMGELS
ncbi:MAG: hypothetical protein LBO03_08665 [Acidaminococcales bacterium]|jgi:uncharacterized protein YaaW (UPF0174 family)|nr:hypothetical protein [Acidaminococcales bacterium]